MRADLRDLTAFVAVARERSFTKAAAKLGVTQSSLSQTLHGLESKLGFRVLTRTTRSVAPTDAGERLLQAVGPKLDEIASQLAGLVEMGGKPAGTIRITATENAASSVLWPALRKVLPAYPDIKVEIVIGYGLNDIVAERLDAGVRPGGIVAKGMIAVRIGPDIRMAVVASPEYLAARGIPQHPQDLVRHNCINLRIPTHGGLFAWEFEKDGRELRVRVDGQLVFGSTGLMLNAALDGLGLAYTTEQEALSHLASGRLVRVLGEWCPPFSGYHLYYPSRRQQPPAFKVLLDALRYRGP